jgi:hypothetical protein
MAVRSEFANEKSIEIGMQGLSHLEADRDP